MTWLFPKEITMDLNLSIVDWLFITLNVGTVVSGWIICTFAKHP